MTPGHGEEQGGAKNVAVVMRAMQDTAKNLVSLRTQQYRNGGCRIQEVLAARRKLQEVELKLAPDAEGRRKVLAASLQAAKEFEKIAEEMVASGLAGQCDLLDARLARMWIELAVLEEEE